MLHAHADTYGASHLRANSVQAGSAAAAAESWKVAKYADIISGVDFVSVAIETSGVWGEQALGLTQNLGRLIAAVTHEPRSTMLLRQRLSVAVQRGNANCVCGRPFSVNYLILSSSSYSSESLSSSSLLLLLTLLYVLLVHNSLHVKVNCSYTTFWLKITISNNRGAIIAGNCKCH